MGNSVFLGRGPHHERSDEMRLWVFAAYGFPLCGALPQPRILTPSPREISGVECVVRTGRPRSGILRL